MDAAGNAYVTGSTDSPNFPTQLALQQFIAGGDDAFVAKVNPAGSALVFSTYLGGTADDVGNAIGVNLGDSSVYVAGSTKSVDFPTVSPIQPGLAGRLDAFVTRLNPAGSALLFSTYLGGAGDDVAQAIAVDQGLVYLTGLDQLGDVPDGRSDPGPGRSPRRLRDPDRRGRDRPVHGEQLPGERDRGQRHHHRAAGRRHDGAYHRAIRDEQRHRHRWRRLHRRLRDTDVLARADHRHVHGADPQHRGL